MIFTGCGDNCTDCPKDVKFPAEMELRVPYQVGQVVRFANALGDTITLNCTEREYSEEQRFAMERPQSECCPGFFVENVSCLLSSDEGDFIRLRTDYTGGYSITVFASLHEIDYLNGNFRYLLDSVQINGQTFFNVSKADEINGDEISIFLGNGGQGVVGFILNGEEWALVD